jgi:hypothetical protein
MVVAGRWIRMGDIYDTFELAVFAKRIFGGGGFALLWNRQESQE